MECDHESGKLTERGDAIWGCLRWCIAFLRVVDPLAMWRAKFLKFMKFRRGLFRLGLVLELSFLFSLFGFSGFLSFIVV